VLSLRVGNVLEVKILLNRTEEFGVLVAVVVKSSVFWDVTPCSPLKVNRTLRKNMSPPSSGLKDKPKNKTA
jgi:hypothetical protein